MAEVMEKKIDENQKHDGLQKPTYAAILKRASPRTTATQSQITTAAVKRVASEEENEPAVTKASVTIANIERKNGDVKTLPRTQSETDTQQENGWKTVPGNFSPISHTSFVRSIPMIYPAKPQDIVQKSRNRMKAPKSKKAQSGSMVSEGGAVSLQEIRLGAVAPSIDGTNPENSHVRNAESFGTRFKNKVVRKLKSVKKIYEKWTKTETEVLPKYTSTEQIEQKSPRRVARKREIGSRVLFAIGFILFAVLGVTFLIQILQRDYQGSRHLMADSPRETFEGIKLQVSENKHPAGTFTIDGDTVTFQANDVKQQIKNAAVSLFGSKFTKAIGIEGVPTWQKLPGVMPNVNIHSKSVEIFGFGPTSIEIYRDGAKDTSPNKFIAALERRFGKKWKNITRRSNKGWKKFSGTFTWNGKNLQFTKNGALGIATWTKKKNTPIETELIQAWKGWGRWSIFLGISGFERTGNKNNKIVVLNNDQGEEFANKLKAMFGDGDKKQQEAR